MKKYVCNICGYVYDPEKGDSSTTDYHSSRNTSVWKINTCPDALWRASFLQTSNGAEIDLIMEKGNHVQVFRVQSIQGTKAHPWFLDVCSIA